MSETQDEQASTMDLEQAIEQAKRFEDEAQARQQQAAFSLAEAHARNASQKVKDAALVIYVDARKQTQEAADHLAELLNVAYGD